MTKNIGVGIIIIKDGKVLLGKRLSRHGKDTWSFPGGRVEDHETPFDCAVRETMEETGLEVTSLQMGPWTYDFHPNEGIAYLTLFVIAQSYSGMPVIKEPDKMLEWRWFPFSNLPTPLFKPIQTLLEQGYDLSQCQYKP